ncbi:MAG: glycerol-3-phosphate acyltransferase [Anaerolineae bacterium]|nr:MAG: glycerol-3-phosphate acyltransferase [Anaerolineae bacterium]
MASIADLLPVLIGYLVGSIPFGFIIVKLKTGQDIRDQHSGRTGGTNAMRAGGFWVGLLTALMDIGKGILAVYISRQFAPDAPIVHALSAVAGIVGHNYSIFLAKRDADGKIRLGGGAGGAAALGGAAGLWWPSGIIIFIAGVLVFYFVGYASATTLSVATLAFIIFLIRAIQGTSPWEYLWFAVLAQVLLVWALRPNIKRLMEGTERLHGYRARKQKNAGDSGSTPN